MSHDINNHVKKVIKTALAEVGYLEKNSGDHDRLYEKTANAGNRNYTKYGKEMHELEPSVMDYPAAWCDCFVDWCFYRAYGFKEAKQLLGGAFNDYTVASAQLYQKRGAWYLSGPKIGDQIFFRNAVRICHTGLVYDVDSTYVYTVEGNTGGGAGVIANGGGVWKKKYRLGDPAIAGYGRPDYEAVADGTGGSDGASRPDESAGTDRDSSCITKDSLRPLVSAGQIHANHFAQCGIEPDGIRGNLTKRAGIQVLQRALNLDYSARLTEDGIWGAKTKTALGRHYVKYGECQYMVTALEILLLLRGYNPNGVECPGSFGSGLKAAVMKYQKDQGWNITGIADASLFRSLIM